MSRGRNLDAGIAYLAIAVVTITIIEGIDASESMLAMRVSRAREMLASRLADGTVFVITTVAFTIINRFHTRDVAFGLGVDWTRDGVATTLAESSLLVEPTVALAVVDGFRALVGVLGTGVHGAHNRTASFLALVPMLVVSTDALAIVKGSVTSLFFVPRVDWALVPGATNLDAAFFSRMLSISVNALTVVERVKTFDAWLSIRV